MADIRLKITLDPILDINKAKQAISEITASGSAKVKIEADSSGLNTVEKNLKNVDESTKKAADSASLLNKAFGLNQAIELTQKFAEGLSSLSAPMLGFETNMAEIKAITGVADSVVADLGDRGRELAMTFGGDVSTQMNAFKGVLSRFGPDIASSPEALGNMAIAINTLSKAGGIDATESMNSLTNTMLQFKLVDSANPGKTAENATRAINVLAASAQVGAAEIPQVAQAIVAMGAAASSANISLEESNGAIQVVAAASGKYGSEAGTALRNVIGLFQKNSGEAEKLTAKLGLPFEKLGQTLNTKGLAATFEQLKVAMDKLPTAAEKNAAMMQLFGTENAGVAMSLMGNIDMLKDFTAGVTGTNSAFEQSAIIMGTNQSKLDIYKAQISDIALSVGNTLGPSFTMVTQSAAKIAPSITAIGGIKTMLPSWESFKNMGPSIVSTFGGLGKSVGTGLKSLGTSIVGLIPTFGSTAAAGVTGGIAVQSAWLPITIAIAAIAAAGVGLYAVFGGFSESTSDMVEGNNKLIEANNLRIEQNKKAQEQEKSNIDLIVKYEAELKRKTTTEKEAKDKEENLFQLREKLNKQYPDAIEFTRSHEENLIALKDATGLANVDTAKFTDENKKLVAEFETLSKKERLSAQEKERLGAVSNKLKEIYPGVISDTKSLSENVEALAVVSGNSTNKLAGLTKELTGLQETSFKLQVRSQELALQLSYEKLTDQLSGLGGRLWTQLQSDSVYFANDFKKQIDEAIKTGGKSGLEKLSEAYNKANDLFDSKLKGELAGLSTEDKAAINTYISTAYTKAKSIIEAKEKGSLEVQKAAVEKTDEAALAASAETAKKQKEQKFKSAEEIQKMLDALEEKAFKLKSERIISEIEDEEQRQIDKIKLEAETNIKAAANEREEMKRQKDIQGKDKAKLEEKHNKIIEELRLVSTSKIAEAETKIGAKRAEKSAKTEQEILKNQAETFKKKLELSELTLADTASPEAQIAALREISDLKIGIIKNENEQKLNDYVRDNENYKTAIAEQYVTTYKLERSKRELAALTESLKSAESENAKSRINEQIAAQEIAINDFSDKLKTQIDSVGNIRTELLKSPFAIAIQSKETREISVVTTETKTAIELVDINSIQDQYERERALKLNESNKTLAKELAAAKNNENLKYLARIKYLSAASAAEREFQEQSSSAGTRAGLAFMAGMTNSLSMFRLPDNAVLEQSHEQALNSIEEEKDAAERALQRGELTTEQYYAKLSELRNKESQENKNFADSYVTVWKAVTESLSNSFAEMYKNSQIATQKALANYSEMTLAQAQLAQSKADTEKALMEATASNNQEQMKALTSQLAETKEQEIALSAKAEEAKQELRAQTYVATAAYAAQAFMTEKNFAKASLMTMLEVAKGEAAIYVFKAVASQLASLGLFGIATGAFLSGMIYAALSAAQAGVKAAKFKDGVVDLKGPGTKVSDSIPAWLSRGETVVNADATEQNKPLLTWLNKSRMPAVEFFKTDITLKKHFFQEFAEEQILSKNTLSGYANILAHKRESDSFAMLESFRQKIERSAEISRRTDAVIKEAAEQVYRLERESDKAAAGEVRRLRAEQNEKFDKLIETSETLISRTNDLIYNFSRNNNEQIEEFRREVRNKKPVEVSSGADYRRF